MVATARSALPPIRRTALPLSVARALQGYVAGNALRMGDRLPSERALAAALQISRAALREGLKYLIALDVLIVRHGVGVFVNRPQHPPLQHLGQLGTRERLASLRQATLARQLIDVELAGLAARHADQAATDRLRDYIAASEEEPLATLREHELDFGYETIIGQTAGNPYLLAIQQQAHRMFSQVWMECSLIPRPVAERNAQHRMITQAIAAHDARRARRCMTAHISHVLLAIGPDDA